jgi:hypothetical protein
MPRIVLAACLGVAVFTVPALAQTNAQKPPTTAQAAQQQRMTACNADASQRSLKGSARQSYMSACLSGKLSQTTLMKICNAQASQDNLSGDARKTYVGSCLKKSG